MVSETKFQELLDLRKKLKPDTATGQYDTYWKQLTSVQGLTEEQFEKLIRGVHIGYTVAYDVYLLKTWLAQEEETRKRFCERVDKIRKVK